MGTADASAPVLPGADAATDAIAPRDAAVDSTIADAEAPHDALADGTDTTPEASAPADAESDADGTDPSMTTTDASDAAAEASDYHQGCGGNVTFRLFPGSGGPWLAYGSGDEEPDFLALFTATGVPLYRTSSEFALENCDCSGEQWPVPIGFEYQDLTDAGVAQGWDGLYFDLGDWPSSGPCAVTAPQTRPDCLIPGCAPPGQYVAYMCACGAGDAATSSGVPASYAYSVGGCANPTCVRVPFEYPSQTVVVGTLGEGDD
jgi:hypothetical protein